ncbi:MAG: Multidrug transporter permease [Cypionkella sp.]|uniref:DMT family transporter n=1 Tax=Cypionkella sp. TaxID=2811411 RepID=UPI0026213DF7|nr:DMT family transporter [Cypionkella sp.]MDB5659638.1 Multidrug transporter permease [Cypionkella sp.]MDB5665327.1 Multidrug transporter permease [Cypionkella sp.]
MSLLWVFAALIGSVGQVARNAMQSSLTRQIGTVGATQVRFLFGLPFALLFLVIVTLATGEAIPVPGLTSLAFTVAGALAQIAATALMLVMMKSQSFAVTTAWLKTEPVIVAIAAALILRDPISLPVLAAIIIASAGVMLMSIKPGMPVWQLGRPVLIGLLAGGLFGASAIGFRGGITHLESGGFLIRATSTLALNLAIQTTTLLIWMGIFNRAALYGSFSVWRSSLFAGFLGAFASQFWFIGFALTSAANVRTLALVEVIFATAVSRYAFKQPVSTRQIIGMSVIVLGVGLLLRLQA